MALNHLGLGFVFTAKDLASSKFGQLERRFSQLDERISQGTTRITSSLQQLGSGLALFSGGAAVLAGGLALANAAGRFEQGLAAVGAVTQATTQQMHLLRDAAIQAGSVTQFSPDEAVDGLQSLATAGQTVEQATKTLIPVLDLAAGSLGQLGVAQAAEAVVGTLNAYGLSADHAVSVTDRLLRVTQLTNFQARDFEAGLAKAAAAGSVFGQELNDVLITMGLLRNRNIDASSSSTAFREAVRRVGAESRAQQAILDIGVDIFDQQNGRMRSIVDIMLDFARATHNLSEEERNRRIATAFGARGLLAFNAILNASFTTMRDGVEVSLAGAEAIQALRQQMDEAQGTALRFREQLLDTFEGQKTLVRGLMQTVGVLIGEPFTAALKPIVAALGEALSALIHMIQSIPAPLKKLLAGFVLASGAFVAAVGAIIASKAAFALLAIALKAVGLSLAGLLSLALPAILVVGALSAVITGFVVALQRDVGGFGALFERSFQHVQLFFDGLKQLFEQGGFSGAVRAALDRTENQGLKRFLIRSWQTIYRLQQLWQGFKAGFTQTIDDLRPVFEDLSAAISSVLRSLGGLFSEVSGGAAALPSGRFQRFGAVVGGAAASVIAALARVGEAISRVVSGFLGGLRTMFKYLRPALSAAAGAIERLAAAWQLLAGGSARSQQAVRGAAQTWNGLGYVLGTVVGGALTAAVFAFEKLISIVGVTLRAIHFIKEAFIGVGQWIGETAGALYLWFTQTLPSAIAAAVDAIGHFFSGLSQFFVGLWRWFTAIFESIAQSIMAFLEPVVEFFQGIAQAIQAVFDRIKDMVIRILREIPDSLLPQSLERLSRQPLSTELRTKSEPFAQEQTRTSALRAQVASHAMPSAAEAAGRLQDFAQLEANLRSFAQERAQAQEKLPPLQIQLQVDAETIAQANWRAQRENASRYFAPVPTY